MTGLSCAKLHLLQAIAECNRALTLLPRFCRALFRRGACHLEAGQPSEAIQAFEELYRVNRDWPRLSEWLLRAHAAKRRLESSGTLRDLKRPPKPSASTSS